MSTPTWTTHSIDTQVALRTAAVRLAEEFRGLYGTEPSNGSSPPPTTSSPTPPPSPSSCEVVPSFVELGWRPVIQAAFMS